MARPTEATHAEVTWRDAVTPLSRASRRRWTACYGLLLIVLAASVVDDRFAAHVDGDERLPLILFVAVPVVFGMLRRGTRRVAALDHPDLDERDIAARNRAYRVALPLFVLVVVAALVLLAVAAPETTREDAAGSVVDGTFVRPDAFVGVGLWIGLWAIFLPTGALAWSEPDALEAGSAGLSEAVRDTVLGLALVVGLVADLTLNANAGFVVFIAALALLGGLTRRAGGQPMMSRQRKWRVAIGLAMILVLLAIALVAGSSGGGSEGGIIDGDSVERTR